MKPHDRCFKKRSVNGYLKRWIAAQAQWRCRACDTTVDHLYEIDHITPLHKAGSNEPNNLQLLCYKCHRSKTWMELALGLTAKENVCARCKQVHSLYFRHICRAPRSTKV